MLQQHVEDNAADGMDDPLETNHTQNGKIEFHDDSDEVQWMPFPHLYTLISCRRSTGNAFVKVLCRLGF